MIMQEKMCTLLNKNAHKHEHTRQHDEIIKEKNSLSPPKKRGYHISDRKNIAVKNRHPRYASISDFVHSLLQKIFPSIMPNATPDTKNQNRLKRLKIHIGGRNASAPITCIILKGLEAQSLVMKPIIAYTRPQINAVFLTAAPRQP